MKGRAEGVSRSWIATGSEAARHRAQGRDRHAARPACHLWCAAL